MLKMKRPLSAARFLIGCGRRTPIWTFIWLSIVVNLVAINLGIAMKADIETALITGGAMMISLLVLTAFVIGAVRDINGG